ncbi:pyridoxamine 5'-phosphate oxidase family protein [Natrinema ejinorense]|uniref:Flavin-nucleotide-binding protein n=1 Tax=Natrinema ejinorense TaxID=373386 RepID=A0A2A5QQ31_9EURY|nr:pyridoxamine 5'-phosphate oxidase family protein [Natrinema ejinorense]PCR88968.1 flavin-nucleotide-binding protein [Natrinema ejinorense]
MDRIEYVYTVGMDDRELEEHLTRADTGVLGLAADGDAYALPVAHHYEGETLYIRLSTDGSSAKMSYLEATDTASYTLYDVDSVGRSWSIIATGPLRKLTDREQAQFDETAVNESFLELRIFDEDVDAVALEIYELEIESITGRRTAD